MDGPEDFIGPVNLGNPRESTIRELAEMILSFTGSRSKLVYLPLPADDPRQRQPDITLARSKLGWEPKVAIEDGLKETISYFRRLLAE
jgi:UDP-glucuronate decarboxylase